MTDELKQLIEDAAKLLSYTLVPIDDQFMIHRGGAWGLFNPLDPERGDLMKVADAAGLILDLESQTVETPVLGEVPYQIFYFTKGNYQSLALAILRVASAVLKAREGEKK